MRMLNLYTFESKLNKLLSILYEMVIWSNLFFIYQTLGVFTMNNHFTMLKCNNSFTPNKNHNPFYFGENLSDIHLSPVCKINKPTSSPRLSFSTPSKHHSEFKPVSSCMPDFLKIRFDSEISIRRMFSSVECQIKKHLFESWEVADGVQAVCKEKAYSQPLRQHITLIYAIKPLNPVYLRFVEGVLGLLTDK